MARVRMSGRGTVALPRAVRVAMGAAPGDRFECIPVGDSLVLMPAEQKRRIRRTQAAVLDPTPQAQPTAATPLEAAVAAPAAQPAMPQASVPPPAPNAVLGAAAYEHFDDEPDYEALPTVMVVDDSATVRKVAQRLLEREGYQVVLASDGVDALKQLQALTPHLMLVDIEMPRMDGFEFSRAVRASRQLRHVPIIIISSYVDEPHRATARAIGVDEYLGKPYEASELLAHVRALLARAMRTRAPV